ncbi:MAG: PAS domain-containing protein [Alphaproteobacteria bacterium]|nr:PAS domain-containing protein [Alphaproteobacteria bacterium]
MNQIARLFEDYWNNIRGDKAVPDFLDFRIQDVHEDVIPYLSLIQVEENPRRFRYSVAGVSVVASYGEDLSGKYYDEMDLGGNYEVYMQDFHRAVDNQTIVRRQDRYTKQDGKEYDFDGHLYPFLGLDGRVNRLVILSIDTLRTE